MARVSRQEIAKNQIRLIYRQYLFGPYDMNTNIFTSGTFLHFGGLVQALARIQKLDQATAVAVPPNAQPYQTPSTYVAPGTNVIGPVTGRDGFRSGNWIKIHGVSFTMRVRSSILAAVPTPIYEHAHVYWRLCAFRYDGSDNTDAMPDPERLLQIPRFGYSKKLDLFEAQETDNLKIKSLASGQMKVRLSTYNANVSWINKYIDLSDKPLKVEYDSLDQNGSNVMRWKPCLVLRSNIPARPQATYEIYQPTINVVTKVHYTEEN